MKRITIAIAAALLFTLTSCNSVSHNLAAVFLGTKASIGNVEYGEISYLDGFAIIDASRENSSWSVEIDRENGLSYVDGKLKGVTKITRHIGRQVTGYLTDLASVCPDAAQAWAGEKPAEQGKPDKK